MPAITIRPLGERDCLDALTALLHRAFDRLAAMGLHYTAFDQTVEVTRQRIARGTCYVAERAGVVVGTVVLEPPNPASDCACFADPTLASAHQLGVEPSLQGLGIGSRLMDFAEQWARARGYRGLCVDTAETAAHLVHYYARRGYVHAGHAQWAGKSYRSVILCKRFSDDGG